jgi:hypothetical protein
MVSGLEIAGVILASIPLIILALEHHGKGVTVLRVLCEYERGIRILARDLKTELGKFQDVCKALLFGSMQHLQIEFMIRNPLAGLWRDEHIKKRILALLSKSSIVFNVSVFNIHKALDLIKERWNTVRATSMPREVFSPRKRLVYTDIMSTLVANIAELQGLAGGLARTEPDLSTPATLPLPNQEWPKMRIIRNLSTNSLTKALRATLGHPSHENIGPELEGTQLAMSSHKESKTTVTRMLQVAVYTNKQKQRTTRLKHPTHIFQRLPS